MSEKAVVVVESPAKAKTINAYLGGGYTVLASYGHIRDLPSKDGSVRPDDEFAMSWEVSDRAGKPIGDIKRALKTADKIILATDPDREGEAISWHIRDVLNESGALKGKNIERVTFNAITKTAIKEAFGKPRALDQDLVDAYLGRRALDYLVGFNLSPILWRKLPGSRSAGRVQSVALRLICDREEEIEAFKPQEYWSIQAKLATAANEQFWARLTHLDGKKLDKFDLASEADATKAVAAIAGAKLSVINVEQKETRRNPYAPFITSSLQMEASRKLGLGAARTMRLAQQLYEGVTIGGETTGLITYMRTDGISLSPEAIDQARLVIAQDHGDAYVPSSPRIYKSKAKNAQEAHEAIRPTDISRRPAQLRGILEPDLWRLYDLIWKRTVASQMEAAILDQVAADIAPADRGFQLRATGQTVKFPGFLALYTEILEDKADEEDGDDERRLPKLATGDTLSMHDSDIKPNQHFTQPPPRFTEASLVKKLEEEGIGRPSTYASILQVLQDRNYVRLENKRFIPEDRGRIVTSFLIRYFPKYVEVGFTASMEEDLDAIADGQVAWREMLRQFWTDFQSAIGETKDLKISDVIDALDEQLGAHFFPPRADGSDPRVCPACGNGRLSLKLGKFGAFIGCSNYPDCRHTQKLDAELEAVGEDGEARAAVSQPVELGNDPQTGAAVSVRPGPYGPYVQMEVTGDDPKAKPKRQGLPKGLKLEDVTLERALDLLRLPRLVGLHPNGEKIEAGVGRFGPYLKIGSTFISLPKDEDVLTVGINRAVVIVDEGLIKKAANAGKGRGRFAKKTAAADAGEKKPAAKKKTPAKKASAKKSTTKKPAAKKAAPKKA